MIGYSIFPKILSAKKYILGSLLFFLMSFSFYSLFGEQDQIKNNPEDATYVGTFILSLSHVIDEMQSEREHAMWYLIKKDKLHQVKFEDASKRVTSKFGDLTKLVQSFTELSSNIGLDILANKKLSTLNELKKIRSQVFAQKIPVESQIEHYNHFIHSIIDVVEAMQKKAKNGNEKNQFQAYLSLIRAKEALHTERVLGALFLNEVNTGDLLSVHLRQSIHQQKVYFETIKQFYGFKGTRVGEKFLNAKMHEKIDRLREKIIFQTLKENPSEEEVRYWLKSLKTHASYLKANEDQFINQIVKARFY